MKFNWLNDYFFQPPINYICDKIAYDYDIGDLNIDLNDYNEIKKFIFKKNNVLIYGDYDLDGISSVVILYKCLIYLNINTDYHIPHRINEGYGINDIFLKKIEDSSIDLVIFVDNGITSYKEIQYLKDKGIDVIIIDHHHIQIDNLPKADYIIHQKYISSLDGEYVCAATLTFIFCKEILLKDDNSDYCKNLLNEFLQLSMLATLADMVPLDTKVNKIISKEGYRLIKKQPINLVKHLCKKIGITQIRNQDLSFSIIPCLNAVGRLEDSKEVVYALCQDDISILESKLDEFILINKRRKDLSLDIFKEALGNSLVNTKKGYLLFQGEKWNLGVLSIAASKLMKEYNRPTIVLSKAKNSIYVGSIRSSQDYDIQDLFSYLKEIFITYGGHKCAGGFKLKSENINLLKEKIKIYNENFVAKKVKNKFIRVDAWINFINIASYLEIQEKLAPFGEKNKKFVFGIKKIIIKKIYKFGSQKEHLKIIFIEDTKEYETFMFFYDKNLIKGINSNTLVDVLIECDYCSTIYKKNDIQYIILDIRQHNFLISKVDNSKINNNYNRGVYLDNVPINIKAFSKKIFKINCKNIFLNIKEERINKIDQENFKLIYSYIKKQKLIDLNNKNIFYFFYNKYNIQRSIILYILKIFNELNFVIIDKSICKINYNCKRKSLNNSYSYNNLYKWLTFRNALIDVDADYLNKHFYLFDFLGE